MPKNLLFSDLFNLVQIIATILVLISAVVTPICLINACNILRRIEARLSAPGSKKTPST